MPGDPSRSRDLEPAPAPVPYGRHEACGLVAGLSRGFQRSAVVYAGTGAVRWRAPFSWALQTFSISCRYVAGLQSVCVQPSADVAYLVGIWDAATGHPVLPRCFPG